MDKEQRAKLLTEIVETNQKNGLYDISGVNKKITMAQEIKNDISVSSRIKHITDEQQLKIIDFIIDYSFEDKQQVYTDGTVLVPLYRVLDAFIQNGNPYQESN